MSILDVLANGLLDDDDDDDGTPVGDVLQRVLTKNGAGQGQGGGGLAGSLIGGLLGGGQGGGGLGGSLIGGLLGGGGQQGQGGGGLAGGLLGSLLGGGGPQGQGAGGGLAGAIMGSLLGGGQQGAQPQVQPTRKPTKAGGLDVAQITKIVQVGAALVATIGLPNILKMFKKAGVGEAAKSWVTPGGPNERVTGDQIQAALGPQVVKAVAKQTGLDEEGAAGALARYLPRVIDGLTPDGKTDKGTIQQGLGGFDMGDMASLVGSLLAKKK